MKTFLKMLQLLLRNYGTLNLKYKTMKAKMQKGGGMRKASTMNPTSRNTAMKALGVKKKSNAYSPSRFGENAAPTTGSAKMKKGGTKKMQSGGTLTSPQYIKDLNDYLQNGILEDIRRTFLGPKPVAKKTVAKKPVAKKSSPKKL
jgi:hypothetical protein